MLGGIMGNTAVGKRWAKWLIWLALVPLAVIPLHGQSKDRPDNGFGPIDTTAPATPPG